MLNFKNTGKLEKISVVTGNRTEYVQGGGGNTSYKLDDRHMAVKASGFRLNQVTEKDGYVVLKYKDVVDYFDRVDLSSGIDYEKDSIEKIKALIVRTDGMKELRPSVEAGFHSLLKKAVIHTHSVYANIILCTENSLETISNIFKNSGINILWVPYINPGFMLTLGILRELEKNKKSEKPFPDAIFMENHGLIVNSDEADKCLELHEKVNELIRLYFGIKEQYPELRLEQSVNGFISKTEYINEYMDKLKDKSECLSRILYPDQLVYLNTSAVYNREEGKLVINTEGNRTYKCSENEAKSMEETMLAYAYVVTNIEKIGLKLKTMNEKETDFILNWESERYRKSLLGSNN